MHALGRLFLGAFALLVAVTVGAAALVLALFADPAAGAWAAGGAVAGIDVALADLSAGLPPESLFLLASGVAKALFALLFVPPAVVGLAGEVLALRGMLWYGAGCGLLTAALPWLAHGAVRPGAPGMTAAEAHLTLVLFVVGACAGLAYWLVAGRGAGLFRRTDGPHRA